MENREINKNKSPSVAKRVSLNCLFGKTQLMPQKKAVTRPQQNESLNASHNDKWKRIQFLSIKDFEHNYVIGTFFSTFFKDSFVRFGFAKSTSFNVTQFKVFALNLVS